MSRLTSLQGWLYPAFAAEHHMAKLVFNPDGADAEVVVLEVETLTVGSAEENDVRVDADTIGPHQVRFEQRNGMVTVLDIGDQKGLSVDGRAVQRFVLGHRAVVQVGGLTILFLEEPAATTALARVGDGAGTELSRQEHCPHCGAPRLASEPNCKRCGLIQPRNADAAPLAPADLYMAPTQSPQARGAGILPMLSFFFGLFGPVVLGIGWLLGIIFGFMSLSLIRQRGGFVRDRRYAMWGIGLGFLWVAAMSVGGFWYTQYREERQAATKALAAVKLNEDQAAFLLKEIAVVQEYLKAVRALPLEGGGSAYASLEQLRTLPNPFVPNAQFVERSEGYLFTVKAQGADGFLATARPDSYGVTGQMTFSIDQTGILQGGDIGAVAPWHSQTVLRPLEMGRSVYLGARERIARELLVEARRQAEEKQFDRSQFILRELQKKYMLTETFKNFEGVARGVEQLIVNAQAEAAVAKVEPLLKEGKKAEALAMMKKIIGTYPRATNLEDFKAQAAALEAEFAAAQNQLADAQWLEAIRLDREGQYAEALAAYRAFASQFAKTSVYAARKVTLNRNLARLENKEAIEMLTALTRLNVRSNATEAARLVRDLQGPYAATATTKDNLAMIQNLGQLARSFVLAEEGAAFQQQTNFVEAADRFDQALALNPSLATELAVPAEECYLKAGEVCLQSNKLVEAAAFFGKFLQLTPNPEKLERDKLKELYFALGEVNYLNRNYTNAVSYLKKGAEFFALEPKYYRMFAQSLLRLNQYAEAMPVYTALLSLTPNDPQARFERGLCGLGISQKLQSNVVAMTVVNTNIVVAAAEGRASTASTDLLGRMASASATPVYSSSSKAIRGQQAAMQSKQVAMQGRVLEMLRDKQFDARISDTLDRVKAYTPQTPEAIIIRESVRLINDIQSINDELKTLARDARNDEAQNKVETARNQLLSIFTTQQDYFDKLISEKLVLKRNMQINLDLWRSTLDAVAQDLKVASTLEVYRGPVAEMDNQLQKKLTLFAEANDLLKPSLASEVKAMEEARELIRLAINKFKGWTIGWDINERIQQFFFAGYADVSDKRADGDKKLREAAAVVIPFEKNITP
ncbi:MAG: hypothetical protein FJ395_00055 [Verrucomicrobia bacterium]|nr:hypothetical protein [Verrucomicrobiota bacterium]